MAIEKEYGKFIPVCDGCLAILDSCDTFQDEFIKSESMKTNLLKLGLQLADVTDDEFMQAISF